MSSQRPLSQKLGQPASVQGIPFETGTELYFGLADELVLSVLPDDQCIAGVPCSKGPVHFHPSGQLAQATLAADYDFGGVAFAKGSLLAWNEDGTLKANVLGQHTIGDVTLPCGASARLAASGELLTWARQINGEGEIVAGIPCQPRSIITLYPHNQPQRLTVATQHAVNGDLVAMTGTDLGFHPNGRVETITLGNSCEQAGIVFEPGATLVLHDDGKLAMAQLAGPLSIGTTSYDDGTYLFFDGDQRVVSHAAIGWSVSTRAQG